LSQTPVPTNLSDCGLALRSRFADLARPQASGADADALLDAVHNGSDPLEVRVEPPVGDIVGVADPVAGQGSFAADVASLSHVFLRDSMGADRPVDKR
jgi:hypothetical protein